MITTALLPKESSLKVLRHPTIGMEAHTYSHVRMITRHALERSIEKSTTVQKLLYILYKSIVTANLRPAEQLLGLLSLAAGLWMGWPFGNQYVTTHPVYVTLADHLHPLFWTAFFVLFSYPAIFGCNKDEAIFPRLCVPPKVRLYSSLCSLWVWTFITLLHIYDRSPVLSAVWAPIIALYQLWIVLWLWTNIDLPEKIHHDYSKPPN